MLGYFPCTTAKLTNALGKGYRFTGHLFLPLSETLLGETPSLCHTSLRSICTVLLSEEHMALKLCNGLQLLLKEQGFL